MRFKSAHKPKASQRLNVRKVVREKLIRITVKEEMRKTLSVDTVGIKETWKKWEKYADENSEKLNILERNFG